MSYYWRGVRAVLDALLVFHIALQNGFWLSSKIGLEVEDQFLDNGMLREKYAEDAKLDAIMAAITAMPVEREQMMKQNKELYTQLYNLEARLQQ